MLASNELNHTYMVMTAQMLLEEILRVSDALGIRFDFINIGGGWESRISPIKPRWTSIPWERKSRISFNGLSADTAMHPGSSWKAAGT